MGNMDVRFCQAVTDSDGKISHQLFISILPGSWIRGGNPLSVDEWSIKDGYPGEDGRFDSGVRGVRD